MARVRNTFLAAAGIAIGMWMVGPAAADGLQRFEKSIKPQIPPDTLTYKSAKGLGDNGFALEDVKLQTPPDPGKDKGGDPVLIKRIQVDDLDFASIEKQAPPLFAKVRIEGITVGAKPGGGLDLKEMAGLDKLSADMQLDYKLEPDRKTFSLNRLELSLTDLGRLELTMVLDGVTLEDVMKPDAAMDNASLRTASLVYDDKSLLSKIMPIVAVMQGMDPKAMTDMAVAVLDGARANQGEKAQVAIDSAVAYVEDYQKPKGPLRITVSPPAKVTSAELNAAKTADEVVKVLGLTVSYPGKRTSKPGEVSPDQAAAKKPGGTTKKADEEKDDDDDDKDAKKK
jgi:hypothetical protein